MQSRIIRVSQATVYCGMCDRVFNAEIRPFLTEIRIGVQGVGFDRIEIDTILDQYIEWYGRAPIKNWRTTNAKKEKESWWWPL